MTRFIYATATTLDGYLADAEHSLGWLFPVEGGAESVAEIDELSEGVGVLIEGSSTYRWVAEHSPEWQQQHAHQPTFVFTSRRELPAIAGTDVRFVSGPVADHLQTIREAAGGKDVWIVGGGDLVGQFYEAGALDEIRLSIAPVTLGSGAPLLPRRLESHQLRLTALGQAGQFIQARYDVVR